jgi:hypothetical protein
MLCLELVGQAPSNLHSLEVQLRQLAHICQAGRHCAREV